MKMKYIISSILVVMALGLMLGVRSLAQPSGAQPGPALTATPTNMLGYVERVNAILKANTAAADMPDEQVRALMNDGIKTNLAAELWARSSMYSYRSSKGAEIDFTVRVLEHLRAGRTNDAIRELEAKLEADVSGLGMFMDSSAKMRIPAGNHMLPLQTARGYWQEFPRPATNGWRDDAVNHALSLLDKK